MGELVAARGLGAVRRRTAMGRPPRKRAQAMSVRVRKGFWYPGWDPRGEDQRGFLVKGTARPESWQGEGDPWAGVQGPSTQHPPCTPKS